MIAGYDVIRSQGRITILCCGKSMRELKLDPFNGFALDTIFIAPDQIADIFADILIGSVIADIFSDECA